MLRPLNCDTENVLTIYVTVSSFPKRNYSGLACRFIIWKYTLRTLKRQSISHVCDLVIVYSFVRRRICRNWHGGDWINGTCWKDYCSLWNTIIFTEISSMLYWNCSRNVLGIPGCHCCSEINLRKYRWWLSKMSHLFNPDYESLLVMWLVNWVPVTMVPVLRPFVMFYLCSRFSL